MKNFCQIALIGTVCVAFSIYAQDTVNIIEFENPPPCGIKSVDRADWENMRISDSSYTLTVDVYGQECTTGNYDLNYLVSMETNWEGEETNIFHVYHFYRRIETKLVSNSDNIARLYYSLDIVNDDHREQLRDNIDDGGILKFNVIIRLPDGSSRYDVNESGNIIYQYHVDSQRNHRIFNLTIDNNHLYESMAKLVRVQSGYSAMFTFLWEDNMFDGPTVVNPGRRIYQAPQWSDVDSIAPNCEIEGSEYISCQAQNSLLNYIDANGMNVNYTLSLIKTTATGPIDISVYKRVYVDTSTGNVNYGSKEVVVTNALNCESKIIVLTDVDGKHVHLPASGLSDACAWLDENIPNDVDLSDFRIR